MILIVGADGAGKRSYAQTLGYAPEDIADGVLDERHAICHVEKLVFADPDAADALLEPLSAKELVICAEVGSGVIPTDTKIRLGRERTGRLCNQLAQRAETVVRLVCGIPMAIKGELP